MSGRALGRLAGVAAAVALLVGCGGYVGPAPVDGARRPTLTPSEEPLQIPPVQAAINGTAPAVPTPSAGTPSAGQTSAATDCPTRSAVGFSASAKIRGQVVSFRLTLTQGGVTGTAWTPDDPKDRHGLPVPAGTVFDGDSYWFFLGGATARNAALRGAWQAKPSATVLLEALAGDGRAIYQQRRTFTFQQTKPDAASCAPVLSYFTALTAQDQISKAR